MSNQPVILLTGATDGIGLALARQYQQHGARLILIGRRTLAELDPQLFRAESYCQADLAQPDAPAQILQYLQQYGIERLDLLIQCAGVGSYGPIEEQTSEQIDQLLDVNLVAPIALTHALLPYLRAAQGQLVLIGSVAATLPAPAYAVYGATKAALEGFARSLRVELGKQVYVQVIHPGATRTGMHAKIGAPLEKIGWQRFPPPERVAEQIIQAIVARRPVATIGPGNWFLRLVGRYAEPLVDWATARRGG